MVYIPAEEAPDDIDARDKIAAALGPIVCSSEMLRVRDDVGLLSGPTSREGAGPLGLGGKML